MKLLALLIAIVAAATADFRGELSSEFRQADDGEANIAKGRYVRNPLQRGLAFLTSRFAQKHVAKTGDMNFRHLRGKPWKENFERFALQKARNGYRQENKPIDQVLPETLSIIETNSADQQRLTEAFEKRDKSKADFVTPDAFKVHTLTKNNHKYDYESTAQLNVKLGLDSEGKVNHFAGTIKCRNNGRQRDRRSPFRMNGRLCLRVWTNPSPPETTQTGSGTSGGGTGNTGGNGQTGPQRPCRRGFRRVAGRCRRVRRRQS